MRRRDVLAALAAGAVATEAWSGSVDREAYVQADDARLYLLLRGQEAAAPVLLWLHGGPGGAERPLFRLYDRGLERRFVVGYLDQRGAGRSFDPRADPQRLTIARHLADLDAVVDHIRLALSRRPVILVGHSWGGALGLLYAQAQPTKVAAVAAVSPLVSTLDGQRAQAAFVGEAARRTHDARALRTLADAGPPPWPASTVLAVQRLVDRFGGEFHTRPGQARAVVEALARGYVGPSEIGRILHANEVSLAAMNAELAGFDLARRVPAVAAPVLFLLGRYDHVAESAIAASYFQRLAAPAKALAWLERSAHNAPFEEPEAFQRALVDGLTRLQVIGVAG